MPLSFHVRDNLAQSTNGYPPRTGVERASHHAGLLQLTFTLGSFYFFSLNKAQEEIMQSCIELARLELEIT